MCAAGLPAARPVAPAHALAAELRALRLEGAGAVDLARRKRGMGDGSLGVVDACLMTESRARLMLSMVDALSVKVPRVPSEAGGALPKQGARGSPAASRAKLRSQAGRADVARRVRVQSARGETSLCF